MEMDCKYVWVWKNATCDAILGIYENLYCMSSKRRPVFAPRRGHLSCGIGIKIPAKNL